MFTTALGVLMITLPQAVSVPPPHCDGRWSAAPGATPSNDSPDGPVLGNGALGVAISATAPSTAGNMSTLVFHIDRNDAWVPATGDLSCCGCKDIDTSRFIRNPHLKLPLGTHWCCFLDVCKRALSATRPSP